MNQGAESIYQVLFDQQIGFVSLNWEPAQKIWMLVTLEKLDGLEAGPRRSTEAQYLLPFLRRVNLEVFHIFHFP